MFLRLFIALFLSLYALVLDAAPKPLPGKPLTICQRLFSKVADEKRQLLLIKMKLSTEAASDAAQLTANELSDFVKRALSDKNKVFSYDEIKRLYTDLKNYASNHGISFTERTDTIGVFPVSYDEIQVSGFSIDEKGPQPAGFIERHELAHLFHCVAVRSVLSKVLGDEKGVIPESERAAVEKHLKSLEGPGKSYRQFEKSVTGISSPVHTLSEKERSQDLYKERMLRLLDEAVTASRTGKMKASTEVSVTGIYALVISKAPILVGTSATEFARRIPFHLFIALVAANAPLAKLGWPAGMCGVEDPKTTGLRDFIKAKILGFIYPDENPC